MKEFLNLDSGPLVSVIVPVYNTQKYLSACVTSILKQTYKNLEVILVDDGSTDGSGEIMNDLAKSDERIRIIRNEKNLGLFKTRINGVKASKGEFLCFIDSDDKISLDWIRTLLNCAVENDCDMVAGDFCYDYGDKNLQYLNLDPLRINDWNLKNDDIFYELLKQNYGCFSWTVVWNKLYKKDLWNSKIDDLEELSNTYKNLNMWEDVAFSSAIYGCAKHFMNVHGVYYYRENKNSETAAIAHNKEKFEKYENDVYTAMQFFKSQVIEFNCDSSRKKELMNLWESWNGKALSQLLNDSKNLKDEFPEKKLKDKFANQEPVEVNLNFYRLTTPVSQSHFWFESFIEKITSKDTEFVSFDIFDTLLKRTVLRPTDIFEIVSNEINKKFQLKCVDFTSQRIYAETQARKKIDYENSLREEITLDEIYSCLKEETIFSDEIIEFAKKTELELEYEFSEAKESGKYLFDLAQQANKKIILISDMYLPLEFVKKLLLKSGYENFYRCYISSEVNLTKATGNIYKFVCKDLKIQDKKKIIHFGDNYDSDYKRPSENGIAGFHISKAEDYLFNRNPGLNTGNGINKVVYRNKSCVDMRVVDYFLQLRCSFGLMASKFYNGIDCGVNPVSDYNADPNKIGYMVLGPHLLSVIEWIKDIVIQEKIPTVHFAARDGYLVKKAFDTIYGKSFCKTNYIRCSRKALLLADILKEEDFYNISSKLNIYTLSVNKLTDYFLPIIKDGADVKAIFTSKKINLKKEFNGIAGFNKAIKIFVTELISMDKLHSYQNKIAAYYRQFVKPGDYIFDIGYSGRPEEALSILLGFPVGSMYIHTNNDIADKRQKICNIKSFNFYEHKPIITGVVREHVFMELGPSIVGFKETNDSMTPVFEDYDYKYDEVLITTIIQNRALEFVTDYYDKFGKYLNDLHMRKDDASSLYEDFISYGTDFDINIFACVDFEDDLGLGHANVYQWLDNERKQSICQFTETQQSPATIGADFLTSEYNLKNVSGRQVLAYKLKHKYKNPFAKFLAWILGLGKC